MSADTRRATIQLVAHEPDELSEQLREDEYAAALQELRDRTDGVFDASERPDE
jgi:hypothetical protein